MKQIIKRISSPFLLVAFALLAASSAWAQPGTPIPESAPISDQGVGSVLIFNYYGSHPINTAKENTEVTITNTNGQQQTSASIFFIDALSGKVMTAYICLFTNQSASFLMSDVDPGAKGYIIVVATDNTGRPKSFNYLTGSESIKMSSGHLASLNAEAISALSSSPAVPYSSANDAAVLRFDGVHYDKVPGVLALDRIPAINAGNNTMIIVNQLGGSLLNGSLPNKFNALAGVVYGAATDEHAWSVGNVNTCQFRKTLSNSFPAIMPPLGSLIPAGASGWMKIWPVAANSGVTGAAFYFNPNAANTALAFTGGRNLHHLTLTTDELVVPYIIPNC